jgi:hypothetical protein
LGSGIFARSPLPPPVGLSAGFEKKKGDFPRGKSPKNLFEPPVS